MKEKKAWSQFYEEHDIFKEYLLSKEEFLDLIAI